MEATPRGAPARLVQDHVRVFFFSLGKLWQTPLGTLLTACVIGVTLALPASLHVLLKNLGVVGSNWDSTLQISLFVKDSAGPERGAALARELQQHPGVADVRYVSREQSLAEFRALSGFGEALDLLEENPLPAVIVVLPRRELGKQQVAALLAELAQRPEVDQAKLDQQWLERLYALLDIAARLTWLVAGLFGIAVLAVVGNTIRLDIEARREEIEIMKLIGAPDGFVRRPFLYTGFWYGLFGGLIGIAFVTIALLAVGGPARQLALLYENGFALDGLGAGATLAMLGSGILLGWFGAYWTVSRHLSKIVPR